MTPFCRLSVCYDKSAQKEHLKRHCCKSYVLVCLSDSQVGVLRVWNVSRSTPLDSFKLKKNGFHALHVLNSPLAKKGKRNQKKVLNCWTSFLVSYLS